MNHLSSRISLCIAILGAALSLPLSSGWGQVNTPPDGFGILPDEVGVHYGPANSVAITVAGANLLDAAPDGEFVKAATGQVLWALRHTPTSSSTPAPGPLDEVDLHRRDSAGQWIYETTLQAPLVAGATSEFGASVVASGNRLFIGAPGAVNSSSVAGGVVYVYEFDGASLTSVQTLELADGVAGDRFGAALAVEGGRLLVGAPGRDKVDGGSTVADAGAVYFHELSGTWSLVRTAWSSQPQAGAQFGFSVGLSGRRFAVGAPYEDGEYVVGSTPTVLNDAGAVYLGRWDAPSGLLAYKNLFPTYAPVQATMSGLTGSHFGWSVAVDDHMRVAVSMPDSSWTSMDNMTGWDSGLVMVMHWNGEMSPDEAFVRTSFSHAELPAGARFGEHVESAAGYVDFGIRTGQRVNNAPVHYYALEAIQAQPGAVVGSVETPRRVGDLVAADAEDETLTLNIPTSNNPYGTHFEIGSTGELRAKSSLATLLDGVYPLELTVTDGENAPVSRLFQVEVTGAVADADRDKMADAWEMSQGLNPLVNDAGQDPDGDGLTNLQEYAGNTDPMDPEGPLLMGGYIDLRPYASLVSQDKPAEGTITVMDGGQGLAFTGNRWVRVPFDYTVTPDTVLEFEFRGIVQGEIHGVGLDEDVIEGNAKRVAQVWGTDVWSSALQPGDYDAYKHHANGWATHRVRIGREYTGTMHHLVIANDDDVAPRDSNTEVRKIRVYEAPIRDTDGYVDLRPFSGYALAYDGDKPKQGVAMATTDGKEIEITGNRWLQWLVNYTVTPLTVVEFSYRNDVQGEIHGLGLDEDTQLNNAPRVFQFHGTQYWDNARRLGTSDWYAEPSGTWKDYRIGVGKSYTGLMRYLVVGNDHDVATPNASAKFKNIRIYEAADRDGDLIPDWWEIQWGTDPDSVEDGTLDPDNDGLNNYQEYQNNSDPFDPEGPLLMGGYLDLRPYVSHTGQDVPSSGTVTVENKGESMTVTGNRWVRVPYDYNVTPNTVMEFEFQGHQQGEIHAVGLDVDTVDANGKQLCQLWGTDVWTNAFQPGDYDGYSHHAPDWKTYRIRVGRLTTGAMHQFFVVNDDDNAPHDASMKIRKVRFYEAPINDAQGYVDLRYWSGYGLPTNDGDVPKSGSVAPANNGRELSIAGNRWLQVLVDYPVTPRTVVEFNYRADAEGETHGLGLDENTELADAARVFRIHGTQASSYTITTPPSQRYRDQGAWRQYRLPVGRTYPAGVMRYLVLANDDDRVSPLASAEFKDIKIYEQADADADGLPDAWETEHNLGVNNATDALADPDHDGLTNLQEYDAGTDPDNPDTDGDTLKDALSAGKLSGYWQMDEAGGVGSEVVDRTASHADGAALSQARIEHDAGLAGTDALYMGLNNLSRVVLPPDFLEMQADTTLSFWMRSSTQGEMGVVSAPSATNHNAYLVLLKDQFLRLYTGVNSSSYVEWEPGLTDGNWHHVVVVREGSAGKARLYVDGEFLGERTATFVTSDIDLLVLGHEADSVGGDYEPFQRFRGFLDEVRFYQRVLSEAEVGSLSLWQPRLQNQTDHDHDGMADAWELANNVTDPQADHDGDGRKNIQEFLAGSDPHDYYNGNPPTLDDIFEESGGLDLELQLGIRDPGEADDDSWRVYINGVYVGRNRTSGGSESDFDYTNILYLPVGITGSFTFELIEDGNGDGNSFELDLRFLNNVEYMLTGYTSGPHGSGYTFTIDIADDFDHDGLMNAVEVIMTTDPWDPDTDGDGLLDGWEVAYGVDPKSAVGDNGADGDPDRDNLTNLQEQGYKTHPNNFDTDGDLFEDDWEIAQGLPFDPLKPNDKFADTDGDGLTDFDESVFNTDPKQGDSDGDGTSDGDEVAHNGQPNDPSDGGQAPPQNSPTEPGEDAPFPKEGDEMKLELTVGDPSGSHSERYDMIVTDVTTGKKLLTHRAPNYGVVETRVYGQFRYGHAYKFEIKHRGTDPKADLPAPDFDGVAGATLVESAYSLQQMRYILLDGRNSQTGELSQNLKILGAWDDREDFRSVVENHHAFLFPVNLKAHPITSTGEISPEADSMQVSMPSPVVSVSQCKIVNVRRDSAGLLIGDLTISGSLTSKVCDTVKGAAGEISEAQLFVNSSEAAHAIIEVNSTKLENGPVGSPYPYSGTFSKTVLNVPLSEGNNIFHVTARDKVYGMPGYSKWSASVMLQAQSGQQNDVPEQLNLTIKLPVDETLEDADSILLSYETGGVSITDVALSRDESSEVETFVGVVNGNPVRVSAASMTGHSSTKRDVMAATLIFGASGSPGPLFRVTETSIASNIFTGSYKSYALDSGGEEPTDPNDPTDPNEPPTDPNEDDTPDGPVIVEESYPFEESNGGEFYSYALALEVPEELDLGDELSVEMDGKSFKVQKDEATGLALLRNSDDEEKPLVTSLRQSESGEGGLDESKDAKLMADLANASFAEGFAKGLGAGGVDLVTGTVDTVKGAVSYVGRGLLVFGCQLKFAGQSILGQDTNATYDMMMEIGKPNLDLHDQVASIATMLAPVADWAFNNATNLYDLQIGLLTGDFAAIDAAATRGGELNAGIFMYGAELISGTFEEFASDPQGKKGYKVGRVTFEVAAIVLPFTKVGKLAELKKADVLAQLLQKNLLPGKRFLGSKAKLAAEAAEAVSRTAKMCFVKGTKITAKNGQRNIESVEVGEYVWSRSEWTGEFVWKQVLDTIVTRSLKMQQMTFEVRSPPIDRDATVFCCKNIRVTDDLPVWASKSEMQGLVEVEKLVLSPLIEGNNMVQVFLGTQPTQPEIRQVAKSTADWYRGKVNAAETEFWVPSTQQFWVSNRNATVLAAHLRAGDRLLQHNGKAAICTGVLIRPIVPDAEFVAAYQKIHGPDASVPLGEPGIYLSKVSQTFQHDKNEVYQIYYGSKKPPHDLNPITLSRKELEKASLKVNEGEGGSVFVTAEHPYYVLNKSKFVQVGELEVGDRFRDFEGKELAYHGKRLIRSVPGDPFKVHNMEVADNHTYFAGKENVWVHNDCPWPVEKAISAYRVLLDGPAGGNKWTAFQDSLRLLLKRGDMINYSQRRLYSHVLDEFRGAGGLPHQCPPIPCTTDAEHSLDEFFRIKKGKWVEPNPNEDAPGMGKQFDRFIDGIKTEYLSPETTDADGLTGAIARKAIETRSKKGVELVVDVTGQPNWSAELRQRAINRAHGIAPEIVVRFRNGDILE